MQHTLGHFIQKGINNINENKFEEGINYINRGIRASSQSWEEPVNPTNSYENISEFIEKKGRVIIKTQDVNNLKLAFYHRGLANKKLLRLEKALLDFRQSYTIDNSFILALIEKGLVQYLQGNMIDAIETMSDCIKKSPSENTYYYRAIFYFQNNDFDNSESDFKDVLALNPYHIDSIEYLEKIKRIKNRS